MEQFKIEVAADGLGRVFDVKSIGNQQYEIYDDETKVGVLEIDGENHEHCRQVNCEIDLPLLSSLREGILLHQKMSEDNT